MGEVMESTIVLPNLIIILFMSRVDILLDLKYQFARTCTVRISL